MKARLAYALALIASIFQTGCVSTHENPIFSDAEFAGFKTTAQQEIARRFKDFQIDSSAQFLFEIKQPDAVLLFVPLVDRLGKGKTYAYFRFVTPKELSKPTIEHFKAERKFQIEGVGIKSWGFGPMLD